MIKLKSNKGPSNALRATVSYFFSWLEWEWAKVEQFDIIRERAGTETPGPQLEQYVPASLFLIALLVPDPPYRNGGSF